MHQVSVHADFRVSNAGRALINSGVRALGIVETGPVIYDPFGLEHAGDVATALVTKNRSAPQAGRS